MNDRLLMVVWSIGLFIIVMNTTMFNVVIPAVIVDVGIMPNQGALIISGYSVVYAISAVVYGRLSDFIPARRLAMIGITIVAAASVFGFFAKDYGSLLAARIVQACGSGVMIGLGVVLAGRYVPYERRGKALATIAAGSALAFGLGPVFGGIIGDYFGWNGLFAITGLVALLIPAIWYLMPQEQLKRVPFDYLGALLISVIAASLLLAVTQHSFLWLMACIGSFLAHAFHQKRSKSPFVRAELLKNVQYRMLVFISFCMLWMSMGNIFLMPLLLDRIYGFSGTMIGLFIAPGSILTVSISQIMGRLIDRYGNLKVLFCSHVICFVILFLFSFLLTMSPYMLLIGFLFLAPAYSVASATLNKEVSRILPKEMLGAGIGLQQLIQFMGGALSVAVSGMLVAFRPEIPHFVSLEPSYVALLLVVMASFVTVFAYSRVSTAEYDSNGGT